MGLLVSMETSFFQKLILTIILAAVAASAIQGARHFATSVDKSMNADLIKNRTPKPTPRRY